MKSRRFFAWLILTIVLSMTAVASAQAAYSTTEYKLTTSTTQAAGHPKLHYHMLARALAADFTGGDDLKTLKVDLPAGLQVNANAPAPRCAQSSFLSDTCLPATQVGTASVKWREPLGLTVRASGTVYLLEGAPSAANAAVGIVLRNRAWKKMFLTAAISNVGPVRESPDAAHGTTLTVDGMPRKHKNWYGSKRNITFSSVNVDLGPKTGSTQNGSFFVVNPSRCSASQSRATITTYGGNSTVKTTSYTPTGCGNVPFDPSVSIDASNLTSGSPTGLTANFSVPTADTTIQHSNVREITVDIGGGMTIDSAAIAARTACTGLDLDADSCPAASRIGSATANVPYLSSAMSGDVFLTSTTGGSLQAAAVLRGGGSTIVQKVSAATSGSALRLSAAAMPQIAWANVSLDITSPLFVNGTHCNAVPVTTTFNAYSGAAATRAGSAGSLLCPPPETTITSSPETPSSQTDATVEFASDAAGATFVCEVDGTAAACASPLSLSGLEDGDHEVCVTATANGIADPTPACVTFVVDSTEPDLWVVCTPTAGTSNADCSWGATDETTSIAAVNCAYDGVPQNSCPPTTTFSGVGTHSYAVTAIDAAGNTAHATVSFTFVPPPDSVAPAIDGLDSSQGANGVTITYSASDDSGAAPTCTPASGTTFPFYGSGGLIVTVTCFDAAGNFNSTSLNVSSNGPAMGLVVTMSAGPDGNTSNPAPTFSYTINRATTGALPCTAGQTCAAVTVPQIEFNCTVDGDAVPCSAGSYTSPSLELGKHTFCVSARGIYSGEASAPACRSFTVINSGSTSPVVTITSPPFFGGSTGASPTNVGYQVNGSSTIPAGTTCSVNGVPSITPTTNSTALSPGTNAIPVTCTNSSGSDTKYFVMTRMSGFSVAITTPAPNSTTSSDSVNVTYNRVNIGSSVTCTINGVPSTSGSINDVALPLGTSSIDLVCTSGNNVAKSSISVTRGDPPTVAIVAPESSSTPAPSMNVSYTVDGSTSIPAGTTCRVNGVSSSSTTTNTVELPSGANLITVSCSNVYGYNTATVTVTKTDPPVTGEYSQVSLTYYTACATTTANTARCWGYDAVGMTGGTGGNSSVPLDVRTSSGGPILTGVEKISVGSGGSACVLMTDQTVKCWGYNAYGQTGDGSVSRSTAFPATVVSGPGSTTPLTGVADITTGGISSCALMVDTTVKCWGFNRAGAVGDNTTINRPEPVSVVTSATDSAPLTGVVSLSPNGGHSCAALVTTQVVCWGDNGTSAINNQTGDALAPVGIFTNGGTSGTPITGAIQAAGGGWSSCVLFANTTASCWGRSGSGMLGGGYGADQAPQRQPDPRPVVAAHGSTTPLAGIANLDPDGQCAVMTDTSLNCWGENVKGAVGDGTNVSRDYATPVLSGHGSAAPLTDVASVSSGTSNRCAVMADGTIRCWGSGEMGTNGDGTFADRNTPVEVGVPGS